MTTAQCRISIKASLETASSYHQAALEGAALHGALGIDAQLLAMSEQYKALRAAGKLSEAAAIKAAAVKINAERGT